MARAETKYVCDTCGRKHSTLLLAEACEKNHYVPQDITSYEYDFNEKERYPICINVKLKDGNGKERIITYHRKP